MDRAEAIEILEKFKGEQESEEKLFEVCCSPQLLNPFTRFVKTFDMAIAALREQEQSKWISDRLPTEEESERVIIGVVNGNNGIITFTDAEIFLSYDSKEKAWWSVDYDIEGCKVKCWYVLPEPPKEGAGG